MNIFSKGFRAIYYCIETIWAKLRFGHACSLEGLLHKEANSRIYIARGGKIHFKNHVSLQPNVELFAVNSGELSIGQHVFFNCNCIVGCRHKITIEDNVMFGPGVTIYDHDHVFSDQGIQPGYNLGEIFIGKGTWIASNVTILRNTHIGAGTVIGAGCIVKGKIPPHSLVTSDRELNIVPIENKN